MADSAETSEAPRRRAYLGLWGLLALYSTVFLDHSQTRAFAWDESYHLLAARLILAGKKPYLDFCFPQTPLNAYWNAWWMGVLGQSWRVAHAFASLFTIGAVALTADFVAHRFPVPNWRVAGALTAGLATGLSAMVFLYGSLGQAYGICLFSLVVAFRIAVRAVGRTGAVPAAAAGLFAGTAAGSSLLTAAAVPVLLAWMLFYNRAGSRWPKAIAFTMGVSIPFAPVFWLFWQGPRATWFNVVQYHAFYRKLYWPDTTSHDVEILTSWVDSGQGLAIGLLALFGVLYVARRSQWPLPMKAEFYLCAWLAAALSAEVGRAHPTFARYFLLTVPFLAILAVAGLYAIVSRVLEPGGHRWPILLLAVLFVLGLGRSIYSRRDENDWSEYERQAVKVDQVTPRGARLLANEPIYFLTRRMPPPGLELYYTHKLSLPPADGKLLHILSQAQVKQQVQAGMFATAYSCDDDEIEEYGLKKLYNRSVEVDECSIFWDLKK